ncbi:amidohydrolase, partial [Candidatus Parcubacteria bacterium]|nr:amidohydrolase [Candidatus Parcubacteria bacterium]
ACLEMIKSGTTTFNEMYFFPEAQIEAIKEMGMRAVIGLVVVDFSKMGCTKENAQKIFFKLKDKLPLTIKFAIAPHAIYTVCTENLIWVKNFAKKSNLLIHMHLSEAEWETKESLKKYKKRPVEYLEKIGLLSKNCLFAHSIWLTEREIEILAKRKCNLIYNPSSNLKLASGFFPYKKISKHKINVCLGTDGPASNNSLDLIREIKIGSLLQKGIEKDPTVFSPKEAIKILTENGARALKIKAGKILPGFLADLILIDLDKIYFQPGHDFLADLLFSASGDCVTDVICDGKILMREGKIEGEEKIKNKVKNLAKNLSKKK